MQTVSLEVIEGTLGNLNDFHGVLVLFQCAVNAVADAVNGVTLFQNGVQIGDRKSVV